MIDFVYFIGRLVESDYPQAGLCKAYRKRQANLTQANDADGFCIVSYFLNQGIHAGMGKVVVCVVCFCVDAIFFKAKKKFICFRRGCLNLI